MSNPKDRTMKITGVVAKVLLFFHGVIIFIHLSFFDEIYMKMPEADPILHPYLLTFFFAVNAIFLWVIIKGFVLRGMAMIFVSDTIKFILILICSHQFALVYAYSVFIILIISREIDMMVMKSKSRKDGEGTK
jgi:hypothetical protein